MKNIYFALICSLLILSCEKKQGSPEGDLFKLDTSRCVFVNKSGVEVAFVVKFRDSGYDYAIDIPDSLVLPPNAEYGWEVYYPATKNSPVLYPDPPLGDIVFIKLYFDKTLDVKSFAPGRYPLHLQNYEEEPNPVVYKHIWRYTFTAEDYQRALEQNNTDK